THAAGVLPGHPLQKRTEVQWDIGTALGADDGADESTSPQVGITPQQAEQIRQHVNRSADSAITGQRFDLYTVEGDSQRLLTPALQICSPGSGKNANDLYENPEMIRPRFETRFKDVLQRTVDQLLEASSKPYSPIIESMRAAAIESFGPFQEAKIPLGMTLISDSIQNTALYSHIRTVPNFKELSRGPSWRSLQPDLRGANVEI